MKTVRTFWHGPKFGLYESLSVSSFVLHGHRVEVYAYDPIELPPGVAWKNAADILPRESLFTYKQGAGAGSYAAFANLFRYKLLYDLGGIWADTDVLCLKSLDDLPDAFIGRQDQHKLNVAVMGLAAGTSIGRALYEKAAALGQDLIWGQTGPNLATELFQAAGRAEVSILPPEAFYPIPWQKAMMMAIPAQADMCRSLTGRSYCVHWWNEIFRRVAFPKDKFPPQGSFLATHAARIIPAQHPLEFWDESLALAWIRNYFDAQAYRKQRARLGEAA